MRLSDLLIDENETIEPEWHVLQKRSDRSNVRGWIIVLVGLTHTVGELQVTAYICRKSQRAVTRASSSEPKMRLSSFSSSSVFIIQDVCRTSVSASWLSMH